MFRRRLSRPGGGALLFDLQVIDRERLIPQIRMRMIRKGL
jgi:hypothetical protein